MMHEPINLNQVQEWAPLQSNDRRGLGFLAVLGFLFLVMIFRRSEMFWDELFLLLLGIGLAAGHRRMLFVFDIWPHLYCRVCSHRSKMLITPRMIGHCPIQS